MWMSIEVDFHLPGSLVLVMWLLLDEFNLRGTFCQLRYTGWKQYFLINCFWVENDLSAPEMTKTYVKLYDCKCLSLSVIHFGLLGGC